MPFITEEIWQNVAPRLGRQGDTLMLAAWPNADPDQNDLMQRMTSSGSKRLSLPSETIRSEANIAPGETLEVLLGKASPSDEENLEKHRQSLEKLAKVKSARVLTDAEEQPLPLRSREH